MSGFVLDARLAGDTVPVLDLPLCTVRLMDDARFPWLLLVPRREGLVDWIDLPRDAQHALADEVDLACRVLRALHASDKLNVATLGNVVAQMHVHVIARFRADAAWPAPVWGAGVREPYAADERDARVRALALGFEAAQRDQSTA